MATLHNEREDRCIACGEVLVKEEILTLTLLRHYLHVVGVLHASLVFLRYGVHFAHQQRYWVLSWLVVFLILTVSFQMIF